MLWEHGVAGSIPVFQTKQLGVAQSAQSTRLGSGRPQVQILSTQTNLLEFVMPVGRLKLAYLGRKLGEVQNKVVIDQLAKTPSAKVLVDEEEGNLAMVDTQVKLGIMNRSYLLELKNHIEEVLEACKDDESF